MATLELEQPTLLTVGSTFDETILDFDETFRPEGATDPSKWKLTQAGVPIAVSAVDVTGATITLSMTPLSSPDLVRYLGPAPPLRASGGAILNAFTATVPFP